MFGFSRSILTFPSSIVPLTLRCVGQIQSVAISNMIPVGKQRQVIRKEKGCKWSDSNQTKFHSNGNLMKSQPFHFFNDALDGKGMGLKIA